MSVETLRAASTRRGEGQGLIGFFIVVVVVVVVVAFSLCMFVFIQPLSTFSQATLWGVRVTDAEIGAFMRMAGLTRPIHKGLVRAHFNMEDTSGTVLMDQGGNNYHGNLVGGPALVPVCLSHLLFSKIKYKAY